MIDNIAATGQDSKLYKRRPMLGQQPVLYSAPIGDGNRCCSCFNCYDCRCFGCLPPNLFPPLRDSAYTWVLPNQVQWNRPTLRERMKYKCCGLCVDVPSKGFPLCCCLLYSLFSLLNTPHKEEVLSLQRCEDLQKIVWLREVEGIFLRRSFMGQMCPCLEGISLASTVNI